LASLSRADAALTFSSIGKVTFFDGDEEAAALIGKATYYFYFTGSIDSCSAHGSDSRGCRSAHPGR
jgi:hypothetical protein